MSTDPLERAIVGGLRSAVRDHGAITPEWIGSAAKRVLGNIANAGAGPAPDPGRSNLVLLPTLRCRCARCDHAWLSTSPAPGIPPQRPERCARCFSTSWDKDKARPRGRPAGSKDSKPRVRRRARSRLSG